MMIFEQENIKGGPVPRSYQQLTYMERCQIFVLKGRGVKPAEIAKSLKRPTSTITRELKRNGSDGPYHCEQAHAKAKGRRFRKPKKMTPEVTALIEEKLKMQWSPEQISGRFRLEGIAISHETIYKYVWEDKANGGSLYKHLRHNGKKYNHRGKGAAGRGCIPNRVDIDQRPEIVNEKNRLGDWELDTIIGVIGVEHDGCIVSMVERMSKLTRLAKVARKTALEVTLGIRGKLALIAQWVLTLTADNGKEFASHEELARLLEADFFFAKPYHSWERGLNEHTNGLVRQYFPKGTRFSEVSQEQLDKVEQLLNQRPRKVLGFRTPLEVFQLEAEKVGKAVSF